MNVVFLDEAEQELLEGALYYENQVDGLGKKFTGEVYRAIARIIDFPLSNQKLTDNIRRKLLKHYPFAVLYSFDGGHGCCYRGDEFKKKTVLLAN